MRSNNLSLLIVLSIGTLILTDCSQQESKDKPSEKGEVSEPQSAEGTISLFNGKNLDGWVQKNGTATYSVVDGTILGKTSEGSPNSFLCTEEIYGDFELEFDVKVDPGLNSGVQIRSTTREKADGDGRNQLVGRVIGPQVEIESSREEGGEAGFIWREATGDGWMTSTGEKEPVPHKIFKDNEWNHYKIMADGPQIKTWINGQLIENVTNDTTYNEFPKGFIGLQVHGIKEGTGPFQVAWKNIQLRKL